MTNFPWLTCAMLLLSRDIKWPCKLTQYCFIKCISLHIDLEQVNIRKNIPLSIWHKLMRSVWSINVFYVKNIHSSYWHDINVIWSIMMYMVIIWFEFPQIGHYNIRYYNLRCKLIWNAYITSVAWALWELILLDQSLDSSGSGPWVHWLPRPAESES
jgi:hypothetical protein